VVEIWFAILVFLLAGFAIFGGWDIGAGAVALLVAKSDPERRAVVAAIGPLWIWNETWLVAAGGTMLLAFPAVLAAAFSGFYLALFLLLWGFIGRGIALELAGHSNDPMWRKFWDFAFGSSSVLLAICLGAAFGNVVRGVGIGEQAEFSLPFFTDFSARGIVGIFDWYTLLAAVFTLACLSAHGAAYLATKTTGDLRARSNALAWKLWIATFLLFAAVTGATGRVRPELFDNLARRPLGWLFVASIFAGGAALAVGRLKRSERAVFAGGSVAITGVLGATAAGVFPVMLHSTLDPKHSITAPGAAAAESGLRFALYWWPAALALSLASMAFVARRFAGRTTTGETGYGAVEHGAVERESAEKPAKA
jgi:cytochrome d ubiquinol oxidase subunit II